MDPTNETLDGGTEVTPSQPSPSSDWQNKYVEIERQYNGLQGTLKSEMNKKQEYVDRISTLSTENETLKLQLSNATDGSKNLEQQFQEQIKSLTDEKTGYADKLTELESRYTVADLIMKKYPNLIGAYGDGAINTNGLEGDALNDYLAGLSNHIKTSNTLTEQEDQRGASSPLPDQPGPKEDVTTEDLADKLLKLPYGSDEYKKTERLYYQSLAQ